MRAPGGMRMGLAGWIATGGGTGLSPRAPGTAGSLAAALIGMLLLRLPAPPLVLGVAALLALVAGLWAVPRVSGGADLGWIVIDEFAGQWLAMAALPREAPPLSTLQAVLGVSLAFALFRLFDIAKPGPVGWLDRREGAVGVMGDDVLAGAGAALVLLLLRHVLPRLIG